MAEYKPVPAVAVEHLLAANEKAAADRETFGSADVTVSVVSALARKLPPHDVLAVMHRLFAIANTLSDGDGKGWRIDLEGQDYTLLDEAIFRAAARAPLTEAEMIGDMKFDLKEFLAIALEESKDEGRA